MKILYIYSGKETDKQRIPEYFEALKSTIDSVKRPDSIFEIKGLSGEIPEEEEVIYWYAHPFITVGMIKLVREVGIENYDGVLIGCVGSHEAEYSLKEILDIPVVGVGEACFNLAQLLGRSFSILTYNRKVAAWLERSIREYRVQDWCVSIRPAGIELLDALKLSAEEIGERFLVQAREAVEKDGAEVIVLGSAGFVGLADYLRERINAPVVDAVEAGVKYIEMLVDLYKSKRLLQSRVGTYMSPPKEGVLKR